MLYSGSCVSLRSAVPCELEDSEIQQLVFSVSVTLPDPVMSSLSWRQDKDFCADCSIGSGWRREGCCYWALAQTRGLWGCRGKWVDAGQTLEAKQIQEVMEHGERNSRRGLGWFQVSDLGLEGGGQPSGGRSLGLAGLSLRYSLVGVWGQGVG